MPSACADASKEQSACWEVEAPECAVDWLPRDKQRLVVVIKGGRHTKTYYPVAEEELLTIEQRFRQLAERWSLETAHVSSVDDLTSHPNYQEIIRLDWDVVPFMLADLQRNQGFWFPALYAITKLRPFDPKDAGNSRRMTEAWLKWGKRKGLI